MNTWSDEAAAAQGNRPSQADTAPRPAAPVPAGQPGLDLLSAEAIFRRPRHLAASPLMDQIPFLFWIVETARPRSIAQVGLGDGVVYMALCQAAERLGRTTVMGFETAAGDDAPLLPPAFRQDHDAHYSDFSVLSPAGPGACPIPDGLDMLVLNAPAAGDMGQVLDAWLPRMSERAVLLVCRSQGDGQTALGGADRPALRGPLSPGQGKLDVVLVGPDQPEGLGRLAGKDGNDRQAVLAARQVFARLGKGIEDAFRLEESERALREGRESLESARADHERRIAELIAELKQVREARRAENERLKQGIEARQESLSRTETAHSRDIVALQDLRERNAVLERQHAERIEDIAILMKDSETRQGDLRKQIAKLQEGLDSARKDRAELDRLRAERDRLRAINQETVRSFQNSTSWRVTAPLRGISRVLGRK